MPDQLASHPIALTLARQHLGEGVHVQLLATQGLCNQAWLAEKGECRIVIRLHQDRDAGEHAKEAWCMDAARAQGIPTPAPLGHGVLNGWHYGLQGWAGAGAGTDHADQLAIWAFLGNCTARLKGISVSGFGETLEDGATGAFAQDWAAYLHGNLAALQAGEMEAHLTADAQSALTAATAPLANADLTIGLCHGDLSPRNVVVDANGQMQLIDWGCAHAHIAPHYDLWEVMRLHGPATAEATALLTGLGITADQHIPLQREALQVMLLCAFDLTRWARDRAPDQLPEKLADLRRLLSQFQELA